MIVFNLNIQTQTFFFRPTTNLQNKNKKFHKVVNSSLYLKIERSVFFFSEFIMYLLLDRNDYKIRLTASNYIKLKLFRRIHSKCYPNEFTFCEGH